MLDRFKEYLTQQHLLPSGAKVLLAVSGGRDSVCMAHLFHRAAIPFAIAHCNFHLRPGDCDRDQQFVRQLAEEMGVDFFTTDFDTQAYAHSAGLGIEEAARQLRYDYFSDLCCDNNLPCVATAHHRDDAVETFFLNLFRGTGIAGLHGIKPSYRRGSVTVIRPMLCFSRRDIDDYIGRHRLAYVEDDTNSQLICRRNRIRHQLMPLLRELYPSVDETMLANMERLRQVEEVYDDAVARLDERIGHTATSPFGFTYRYFDLADLADLHPQRTLLFELLRPYGFSPAVVDDIIAALPKSNSGTRFSSPDYMAAIDRERLILVDDAFCVKPQVDIAPVALDRLPRFGTEPRNPYVEYVDADVVRQPLSVRQWKPGDRFYPLGMTHQRRLSDFLKDCKVNVFEKYCVYVVVDADDRIVWVICLRPDNRFRITDATRHALRLTMTTY